MAAQFVLERTSHSVAGSVTPYVLLLSSNDTHNTKQNVGEGR